jgi:hypothetical protein
MRYKVTTDLLAQMIAALPNMAVALLTLYWMMKRIDALLTHQAKLIDQLVETMKETRHMAKSMSNGHRETKP